MSAVETAWQHADPGMVHTRVLRYVEAVERVQADIFDRFVKLDYLYDPTLRSGAHDRRGWDQQADVQENVIASNCDAITGTIAASEVRARFMTDDAPWSVQRRARHLELYAEGLAKQTLIDYLCKRAFHDASRKGTGVIKIYVDRFDQIRAELVQVDDIVVDESEARGGAIRQMHQRVIISKEELKAQFPDYETEIEAAQSRLAGRSSSERFWADYRPIERDCLVCLESWYLPIGPKGHKQRQPGRHTIVIDGVDLLDDEWNKDHFPFAVMKWTERPKRWYGISGAERIRGHQKSINKLNWQIDRLHDNMALPVTYVRPPDASIAVKTATRGGQYAVVKGEMPKTIIPPAVSPETYNLLDRRKSASFEEFGQSRMSTTGMKPPGLDSGIALREYKDQTTQRFADQEKGHEQLKLDCVFLLVDCCKDLGKQAPPVVSDEAWGEPKIEWPKVDMGEVKVQIVAASTLSRTPAGRLQLVMEFAQAGVISQDEARRLMRHPDLERAMSLYTASMERIEKALEQIKDGVEGIVPTPYMNLKMAVWRAEAEMNLCEMAKAPEDVIENLALFVTLSAWMVSQAEAPAPSVPAMDPMAAGAAPMDPAMAGAMPPGPPMMGPGVPAAPGDPMAGAGVTPLSLVQ